MAEQKLPKLGATAEIRHPSSKTQRLTGVSFHALGNREQNKKAPPDGHPTRPATERLDRPMVDAKSRSPAARRKRQEALNAEYEAIMGSYRRGFKSAPPIDEPPIDGPEPAPTLTTIYFIQGIDGGPVKIGLSDFLQMRLTALQMASPVKLVVRASVQAERSLERDYHTRFAAHRLHGEWFEPHPDILAEIERLAGQ